jgi:hypothetical protein
MVAGTSYLLTGAGKDSRPLLLRLLGEIVLEANLRDGLHLRFNPIDMRVDSLGHVFKHVTGREVVDRGTVPYPVTQQR